MSGPFSGFSTRREDAISLPIELFTRVLAEVQEVAELKVLLTVFRLVAAQKVPPGRPRLVSWEELRRDEVLRQGLAVLGGEMTPEERLDRALERAVARGTLLHLVVQRGGHAESWYMLNTAANRRLAEGLGGEPGRLKDTPLEGAGTVRLEMPTIFRLYEENIGLVPPLLVEELEEAARTYPPDWVEEAFREAVAHNRRSWRYIRAILERWAREGRGQAPGRRERPIDFEKYTRGEYADLFGEGATEEGRTGERSGRHEQPNFEKYTRGEYADLFGETPEQEEGDATHR
ncbi:MAG: DnaD domain-containing protein [Chloroflexia bacterium]